MKFLYCTPILWHHFYCRYNQLFPLYKVLNVYPNVNLNKKGKKIVVLMVRNETTFSGGLSDRLRGIISVYQECKQLGLVFKIHFETPNLIDYLEPNDYDWYIKPEDICYDTKRVYPCTILTYRSLEDKKEPEVQRSILRWVEKVGDVQTMADRICLLIENESLRREMGENAKSMVNDFSVDKIRQQWLWLLNSLTK